MTRSGIAGTAGRASDEWVERVRAATDLVELATQTVQLKRVGRNWVGLCPFHKEKTPSFTVSPERQLYHCFSCKAGGDVFRFVQEMEKVGFVEAVELLGRRAGVPAPERRTDVGGLRHELMEALELAAKSYEHWLRDPRWGEGARSYLRSRGVSKETIRVFRLGLAPDGWHHLVDRLRGRVSDEILVQSGLAMRREEGGGRGRGHYDRFRNRLMIPLVSPGGGVVGFGARALGDETPKYLNSPESPAYRKGRFVFALDQARRFLETDGELIVVEGYFDAISFHQAGLPHTVATSGTALTVEHARVFRRLVRRVAITFDGDEAGRDAAMRSLGILLAEGIEAMVVELPSGEDPDTLIRRQGVEGWAKRRAAAYDVIEFVQRHVLRAAVAAGVDLRAARERAVLQIVELTACIPEPVRAKLVLERAAEVFGVEERVLSRSLAMRRSGGGVETAVRAEIGERQRAVDGLERQLLKSLIRSPEALASVRPRLSPEDFRDPRCRELALWLWTGSEGLPSDDSTASLARELSLEGPEGFDWAAEAQGAARAMVERRLKRRLTDCRSRLSQATEQPEAARLMQEIDEIARSLRELNT